MTDFSFSIGDMDAAATPPSVPVTFTIGGKAYSRSVNAVAPGGVYNAEETLLRVLDVGRGVLVKVALGVLLSDDERAAMAPADPEASEQPEAA